MRLQPETIISVARDIAVADLGDESVVLDPTSGKYFGLNEVAARIITIAKEETTFERVVDQLLSEFEVDRSRLESDVALFVQDLEGRGLLVVSG